MATRKYSNSAAPIALVEVGYLNRLEWLVSNEDWKPANIWSQMKIKT